MGLDIYLYDGNKGFDPMEPSTRFPEHISGKTYLRSSYNDSGFDRVSERLYGVTLDDIFDAEKNGYFDEDNMDENGCVPMKNLDIALEKAKNLAYKFDNEECPLFVITITNTDRYGVNDSAAIDRVKEAMRNREKNKVSFDCYSNNKGWFFLGNESLDNVRGIIPGVCVLGRPAIHIVYEPDQEVFEFYQQMAHIVVEFIEFAMTLEEPKVFWSC